MLDDLETTILRSGSGKVGGTHAMELKRRKDIRQQKGENVNSHMLGKKYSGDLFLFYTPFSFSTWRISLPNSPECHVAAATCRSEGLVCEEK